jgi:hypothetical protein
MADSSCFPDAAKTLNGLIKVAATPPITDVLINFRRVNEVMILVFGNRNLRN